ncbi:MAG TPA: class I SAM-dependent methyltransferase [Xanthobacteraceae bacterium]|nr:class I SAM-dependent methyltransferase [Xanthobacteraceae bacterium]
MPPAAAPTTIEDPRVKSVLRRLHRATWGDLSRILASLPQAGRALARDGMRAVEPALFASSCLGLSPEQGRLLYITARAIGAKRIVEFGTSFGISTIYLAAAVRDNGGGLVIGSESEADKCQGARANLAEAGLSDYVDVRLGDARQTLADIASPVDFVLLDGWKELYLPILDLLIPKLRQGAVVLADDVFRFRRALAPYVELMQSGRNGFHSTSVRIGGGFEFSVYNG